jgi:hypothetical protein
VSSPGDVDTVPGTGPAPRRPAVPELRLNDRRDPWLRMGPIVGMVFPLAGQPGHGRTAFVRRQPGRIVDGRVEGGYTGAFELICPGCGDNPYVDYSEVPSRLQWLRGPRTLEAALKAYDRHLGPFPGPNGDSAGS